MHINQHPSFVKHDTRCPVFLREALIIWTSNKFMCNTVSVDPDITVCVKHLSLEGYSYSLEWMLYSQLPKCSMNPLLG